MHTLRTHDARFLDLPGYPYAPCYVQHLQVFEDLRLHYLDEGRRDAANTFLCLHGQPTWSYLYRKMIPVFTAAGVRVIAPDLYEHAEAGHFAQEWCEDIVVRALRALIQGAFHAVSIDGAPDVVI